MSGFATGLPQTMGALFGEAITGRWFAAIATILRELIFQGLNARA